MLREVLTRYGRHNIGFLWLFAEPMIFTLGITILWNLKGVHGHTFPGITITAFVLSGYSTVLLWRNMPGRCVGAVLPNGSLMYHRQVKPIDIYLSRIFLEAIGATASLVILTILFASIGLLEWPKDPLTAFYGWILLAWYALAVSLFIGALGEQSEIVDKFWHPMMYLFLPLSGAFFIVDMLPKGMQELALLIPSVSCIELFREGFFGTQITWHYNLPYVVAFNMLVTMLGLAQVRYISRTLVMDF
jgi:ABC-2 type transport system permease protein/capsular polysaccharide transport system permease protein